MMGFFFIFQRHPTREYQNIKYSTEAIAGGEVSRPISTSSVASNGPPSAVPTPRAQVRCNAIPRCVFYHIFKISC